MTKFKLSVPSKKTVHLAVNAATIVAAVVVANVLADRMVKKALES